MSIATWYWCVALATLSLLGLPSFAAAQGDWESVVIRGGALVASFGSDVRIDGTGRRGTSIDLEDDLKFKSREAAYFAEGAWRISRRHSIRVNYVNASRSVSRTVLTDPITIGDTTFTAQAEVDSFLDTWYLSGDYGFAFVATPSVEVGVSIGVTAMQFSTGTSLSVEGSGGAVNVGGREREDAEFTVPVPLPGVFFNVRPHPRVTLNGSWRYIKAHVDTIDGSVSEARAGADVRLAGAFGLGASYYFNSSSFEREGRRFNGRVEYSFNGPQVYGVLAF